MKTLFVFFIALISFNAHAQSFGLKGGLNVSDIAGINNSASNLTSTDTRTAFHAGAFFLLPLSERFKIMPQVIYSEQGATSGSSTASYNYLNVPIMFNIYASDVFFFQFGPQLGVLTAAKISNGSASLDVKNQLTATDFSFCLGLGVEYEKFLIGTNYNMGFTGIYKSNSQASLTNSVFQISVGYKLLEYEFAPKRKHSRRW